jgi:hypothetical protein
MNEKIKPSAIPAAGYVYQTMQGLNLLCDWLDAPSRFVRVRFECDDDAVAPQGLDDLVAERADARVDVWQVKFTPSPGEHLLDWGWLLTKPGKASGKSRSNLRKWFDAFDAIEPARLGEVRLLTNRVPDLAMEKCLAGGLHIDYPLAPAEVVQQIEKELGGAANAKRFFDALEVKHSDKSFLGMEAYVTDRLRRHAETGEGIEALKNRAIHWSIVKNEPAPDGWITLELLKSTLRVVAPEPLPEDFAIPPGYRVPDTEFHTRFMASITATPKKPIVLTGPPGRGKSTYLSKVCELLQKEDIPFVRHHYYLSSTDRSHDRYTSFAVQESLLAQVKEYHKEVRPHDTSLASTLAACAQHYKASGKPFVVFLDGLDHVWRTQGHDKRPLDDVFNQILPACDNLVLVVGTQPVEDAQLPSRLLLEAPRGDWHELPAMSADAVLQYLRKEVNQGRLQVRAHKDQIERELQAAATELRQRTGGHPLHVIYATEELVRTSGVLSAWNVEQLAGDLSGDAKQYYGSLWLTLAESQRDALRLVCEFPFFWPKSAFHDLAALASSPAPSVPAVEHLLHSSVAGLRPFHESLIVFVRQTDGYGKRINQLTPFVEQWLASGAPNALRVNWLWAVKAKQGSPSELIDGLQRDWVLERIQEGYPTTLFEDLLEEAEECAVQAVRYADAYRLRHLKTRLLNSLEFQLIGVDAARLQACTWTLAPDQGVLDERVASRHDGSVSALTALADALYRRGETHTAETCAQEALRRYRGESRFSASDRGSEAQARTLYLVKVSSKLGTFDQPAADAADWMSRNSPRVARELMQAYVDAGKLRTLIEIAIALPDGSAKAALCDSAIRAAALAEVDLTAWSEFPTMSSGNLIGCLHAIAGDDITLWLEPLDHNWQALDYNPQQEALKALAHDWLFGSVRLRLVARGDVSLLKAPRVKDREKVATYLDQLAEVGGTIAQRLSAQELLPFAFLYEAFSTFKSPALGQGWEQWQGGLSFQRALHVMAIDLHLISSRPGGSPLIDVADLKDAMAQAWFDANEFRTQYVSGLPKVLSDDAAHHFIRSQLAGFDAEVNEETGVRRMAMLELCEMAIRHGLTTLATNVCKRTWELVLGYGQRKDPALSDVMDALDYLLPIAPEETRRLLVDISPQVHNVLKFTDGKGTRHLPAQADQLLALLDRGALVEKYREHTEAGDWNEAEDSLREFIKTLNPDSAAAAALLRTGIHFEAVDALAEATKAGNADAARMLTEIEKHGGADVGRIYEPPSPGTKSEWKEFAGDVKTYGVTESKRLLSDLREHVGVRADVLRQWYQYWEAQGLGSQLIKELEPTLLSDSARDADVSELLDLAFETKLRLEGAAAAFPYVVQAQLFRGGWIGPMHMEAIEKSEARLRRVVKTYKRRGDEFFRKSAYSFFAMPRRERVIPSEIMVFYLGLQGRRAEAIQYAEAMVRSTQEDTRMLRLQAPAWAAKLASTSGGEGK